MRVRASERPSVPFPASCGRFSLERIAITIRTEINNSDDVWCWRSALRLRCLHTGMTTRASRRRSLYVYASAPVCPRWNPRASFSRRGLRAAVLPRPRFACPFPSIKASRRSRTCARLWWDSQPGRRMTSRATSQIGQLQRRDPLDSFPKREMR